MGFWKMVAYRRIRGSDWVGFLVILTKEIILYSIAFKSKETFVEGHMVYMVLLVFGIILASVLFIQMYYKNRVFIDRFFNTYKEVKKYQDKEKQRQEAIKRQKDQIFRSDAPSSTGSSSPLSSPPRYPWR